jgi:putative intracellular protease/amidase
MGEAIHVLVFEGLADWEAALALAELRRTGKRQVVAVGFDRQAVVTMGGLRVTPDRALSDLDVGQIGLLIVPGGDRWEAGDYPVAPTERLLTDLVRARIPVAAICGGTVAAARAGLFDGRRHTSNDRDWLQKVAPGYRGRELYRDLPAVRDDGVISASSTGSLEFAGEIFAQLGLLPPDRLATWYALFKTGHFPPGVDAAAFFAG